MKVGRRTIDISNRDKVFFPDAGVTKGDLIDYYAAVANTLLPHTKRYGVSMERYPDGISAEGFFNKDAPDYFPHWIRRVDFPKREGGSFNAPIIDREAALIYLADQAMITPHLYLSRTDNLERPDKMIYDLDPPEGMQDFQSVRRAALDLHAVLGELDLDTWIQTTGSKGFHIIVPLDRSEAFDEVRAFAHDIALLLVRRHEDRYTLEQRKRKRKGRIFLDVLRNAYGATAVAPYAVRAHPGAPVATPVEWDEVARGASPRDWDISSLPRRLAQKGDPWSGLMRHAQAIADRREALDELLEGESPA
jgi:bifunctional non-homologous end joining protein LigD